MTWGQWAACKGTVKDSNDPFYSPEDDDQNYSEEVTWQARAVCSTCPVREACLEYALEYEPSHGIFGGLDPTERRKVVLERALQDT